MMIFSSANCLNIPIELNGFEIISTAHWLENERNKNVSIEPTD